MKKIILMTVLLLSFSHAFESVEALYRVNVKEKIKGAMELSLADKSLNTKYINISEHDKIAFFAKEKKASLMNFLGYVTMSDVMVGNIQNNIIYDLSKVSKNVLDNMGVSKADVQSSALIVNVQNSKDLNIDKLPVHTMESIMASIYKTGKIYTKPFYLYEPHKGWILKVNFSKSGAEALKIKDKTYNCDVWTLGVSGRTKNLVKIYTAPYPIKLEAYSKSWSMVVEGIGPNKTHEVKKALVYFPKATQDLKQKYHDYVFTVLEQKNTYPLTTLFSLTKTLTQNDLESYLNSYLSSNSNTVYKTSKEDDRVFTVTKDDVIKSMKEKYDVISFDKYLKPITKTYLKSELQSLAAKEDKECIRHLLDVERLSCGDDEKKIDFKKLIEAKIANEYKEYSGSDIDEEDDEYVVKFNVETDFTKEDQYVYIQKAFLKKFKKYSIDKLPILTNEGKYEKRINIAPYKQFICNKIMPFASHLKGLDTCALESSAQHNDADVNAYVTRQINDQHPMLKILSIPLNISKDSIGFTYRSELKGL